MPSHDLNLPSLDLNAQVWEAFDKQNKAAEDTAVDDLSCVSLNEGGLPAIPCRSAATLDETNEGVVNGGEPQEQTQSKRESISRGHLYSQPTQRQLQSHLLFARMTRSVPNARP